MVQCLLHELRQAFKPSLHVLVVNIQRRLLLTQCAQQLLGSLTATVDQLFWSFFSGRYYVEVSQTMDFKLRIYYIFIVACNAHGKAVL